MFISKVGKDGRVYIGPFLSRLGWVKGYSLKAWRYHDALAIGAAKNGPIKYQGGSHIWIGSYLRELGIQGGDLVVLDVDGKTLYVKKFSGDMFDGFRKTKVIGKSPKWYMNRLLDKANIREGDVVDIWAADGEIHIVRVDV